VEERTVTEALPFGAHGPRSVTVALPPTAPEAVVFAGDGGAAGHWGALLAAADVPPTAVVGVHGLDDEDERLREYSPVFDAARFAAHERLFVHDVRRWVDERFGLALPAARTAVFGASAGGELALALGLRHPDLYGTILAGSPGGGFRPGGDLPGPFPRTYLVAGTDEPFFLENAVRWAEALGAAGADVVLREREGGQHGPALWDAELPRMVAWAFG
jgi:enterochelin esterase-like enzyme